VIYGLKKFDGNLTREHLSTASPYNTYLIAGLPPTPICNPGRDSLLAAVSPAPVSYLYFVSRNDGTHVFSSNIEDHNGGGLEVPEASEKQHGPAVSMTGTQDQ